VSDARATKGEAPRHTPSRGDDPPAARRIEALRDRDGVRGAQAHVNTAYFAWGPAFEIVWLSAPEARHSRNIRANPSAALAVYRSTQNWGDSDHGIQLFGTARELRGRDARVAERLYAARFKAYEADLDAYRFYRFRPRRIKLFDEHALGGATFVTVAVGAGGRLRWVRTESYV